MTNEPKPLRHEEYMAMAEELRKAKARLAEMEQPPKPGITRATLFWVLISMALVACGAIQAATIDDLRDAVHSLEEKVADRTAAVSNEQTTTAILMSGLKECDNTLERAGIALDECDKLRDQFRDVAMSYGPIGRKLAQQRDECREQLDTCLSATTHRWSLPGGTP